MWQDSHTAVFSLHSLNTRNISLNSSAPMIAETKKLIEDAFEDLKLDVLEALGNFLFSLTQYCGLVWNKLCKPSDSGILITSGTEFVLSKIFIVTHPSHYLFLVTSLVSAGIIFFLYSHQLVSVPALQTQTCPESIRLDGKTAVLAGACSEVGCGIAVDLMKRGVRVIMVCVNYERGEWAAQRINAGVGRTMDSVPMVEVEIVDMAEMEDVRRFADKLVELGTPIDILVCNGSLSMGRMYRTEAGLELMVATNHLSFFLLVNLLLPAIAIAKVTI